jgi:hypothetical protein
MLAVCYLLRECSRTGLKNGEREMAISGDGDLREQLEARERWWRDRYAELWQRDLIPAVKAWSTIQYRRIQRKERAWVRQALLDMALNDQAQPTHKSGTRDEKPSEAEREAEEMPAPMLS